MKIAMIGCRGVPATFGGIEHHVEQVGSRIAARGHEVTVYCRPDYVDGARREHLGMQLRTLPTVPSKHLEALAHSGVATLAALVGRFDVVHYHAIGPTLWSPLPRALSRSRVVTTIHGLDFEREKWGSAAGRVFRLADQVCARVPHERVVVATNLAEHYRDRHDASSVVIRNGVVPRRARPLGAVGRRLGITDRPYLLFVGRLTPEKGAHVLVEAFRGLDEDVRLVVVGGSSHTEGYVESLRQAASEDSRIVLTGYLYGADLEEVYSNASGFVQPSSLEGMPLTVLEAASYALPLVLSDIPVHRELLGESGPGRRFFPVGSVAALRAGLEQLLSAPEVEKQAAVELQPVVLRDYDWDDVVSDLLDVYAGRRDVGAGR